MHQKFFNLLIFCKRVNPIGLQWKYVGTACNISDIAKLMYVLATKFDCQFLWYLASEWVPLHDNPTYRFGHELNAASCFLRGFQKVLALKNRGMFSNTRTDMDQESFNETEKDVESPLCAPKFFGDCIEENCRLNASNALGVTKWLWGERNLHFCASHF